ncbi:MAG: hypothetical protein F4Y45_03555 [Acidobacteria bacterium]|nr:hypothetical protein [Acidobacteriota bacterium]MXZ73192.1 hypothetical protein [Acidobacteriota bacterium]MYD70117.1 hypothetical protein [Acidobacteriota bacterium]MYJ05611.1 hypothetical protein [Acidobacteriota bacterium]
MKQEDFLKDLYTQEIRNTRIHREVDAERQREFQRLFLVVLPFVILLLVTGWQHFQLLQHGYEVERLRQEQARELETNRHLRLEIETLRAPGRIERIATEQLDLVAPAPDQAIVIERRDDSGARESADAQTN